MLYMHGHKGSCVVHVNNVQMSLKCMFTLAYSDINYSFSIIIAAAYSLLISIILLILWTCWNVSSNFSLRHFLCSQRGRELESGSWRAKIIHNFTQFLFSLSHRATFPFHESIRNVHIQHPPHMLLSCSLSAERPRTHAAKGSLQGTNLSGSEQ